MSQQQTQAKATEDAKQMAQLISLPSLSSLSPDKDTTKDVGLKNEEQPSSDSKQKQIQADLKTLKSASAEIEEKIVAKKRLFESGQDTLLAIKEELKTVRGDDRNELLRLRIEIGKSELKKFGNEFVELDYDFTTDRVDRLRASLEAKIPGAEARTHRGMEYYTHVDMKDAREVFALMCDGLKSSKEVLGTPSLKTTNKEGTLSDTFTVDLKDGRSVILELSYGQRRSNDDVIEWESLDALKFNIVAKGQAKEIGSDNRKTSGRLINISSDPRDK